MNIRKFTICILMLGLQVVCLAQGSGKMVIRGKECCYDTLLHRTIAPGTTLTQYQFNNIPIEASTYKMKAHVITIDMTNPYNSFTPYLAKNKYFEANAQSQEVAIRKREYGLKPVATMTGGGFVMPSSETSKLKAYEVVGSVVTNGEIKYETSDGNINCYTDKNKISHIGKTFLQGTLTANGNTYTIGQVNHCRDVVDSKELITLFCNGINISRSVDANTGTDVKVKLIDTSTITSGTNIQCKVLNVIDGCCNTFNTGEAILSGVGKAAEFLKTLKTGDDVTINLSYVDANKNLVDVQDQITNFFGYCIKDGEVQPYDTKNYAICVIGNSEDGKTSYWADLEISSNSNAPCICLADLLKNIGVYEAMWLDGGPSAEMTVDGKYITNNSIGIGFEGRYIPAGYILYSTAPDDNTVTRVELDNPSERTVHIGDKISLNLYGYNQYDEMIQENAINNSAVQITCTDGLGIIEKGIFTAKAIGNGYIYVKVNGSDNVISVPVNVIEKHILTAYPQKVFTGEGRACQIKLTYTTDAGTTEIDPSAATWTKAGKYVLTSCENGLIEPFESGKDNVFVTYDGVSDTIAVEVENLSEEVASLDLTYRISHPTYIHIQIPSVPRYFKADISGTIGSTVTLSYSLGSGQIINENVTIGEDGTASVTVPLDYDAVDTYPVTILNLSDASSALTGLYAIYQEEITGVNNIISNDMSNRNTTLYNLAGQRVNSTHAKGILIRNGKKIIVR